jgi:hypothetical protein
MRAHSKSFLTAVFTALLASCWFHSHGSGTNWPMTGSTATPAANGEVTVSEGSNGNTQLTIKVHHLAPPQKVAANATGYVAWVVPVGPQSAAGQQINVGAIQLDSDLSGSLRTVTPQRRFDVIVTPESNLAAGQPTNPPVLTASIR